VDTVRITKVNRSNFIVVSEARVRDPRGAEAHARLGMLIPLRIPQINMRGAFTSRGNLKIGGASTTDGNDHTLPNWNCPPLDTAIAGVSVSDTNSIQWAGQNHAATGNPPVLQDTVAAHDSTYQKFGDIEWEELVAMAQKVITSGSSGAPSPTLNADGTCKTSDLYNWGDPERAIPDTPCANYYPIIYATGNLQLSNGVGQGMLLVEGDLKVTAFRFYGPVIVKGSLDATGPGSTFTGGVLAGNASGSTSSLGNSSFKYSSCALMRAMAGSATPLPNRTRSWLELF
jgi:hypothetical protein